MKKSISILFTLALLPIASFAGSELPAPKADEEICYARVYSDEHLAKNPNQAIKAVAITLARSEYSAEEEVAYISGIHAVDLRGTVYHSGGQVLSADGRTLGKLPAKSVAAQMDGDGGRFLITQNQKNPGKITAKVLGTLMLEEEYENEDSSKVFYIQAGGPDALMALERRVAPSNGPSCITMLKSEVVAEAFQK
jgi:hypothetical protein